MRARPSLPGRSLVRRHGIPVTDPVQTLIDLATELKNLRLERAVNEADKLDLVDPETLREARDGRVGGPGVKALRTLLDRHTFRLSDSDLEILFRPLAAFASLRFTHTHWQIATRRMKWPPSVRSATTWSAPPDPPPSPTRAIPAAAPPWPEPQTGSLRP